MLVYFGNLGACFSRCCVPQERKGSQKDTTTREREPKGNQWAQEGAKREPRGAKGSHREPKGAKWEPKGAKREPKGGQKEANKHPKVIKNGHRKQTKQHIENTWPKATKRHQKGGQKVTLGRLGVDKRLHRTQNADMRQTLACVCQNDIGEAVRPLKINKKPPRNHFFRNSKKNNQKMRKTSQKDTQQR